MRYTTRVWRTTVPAGLITISAIAAGCASSGSGSGGGEFDDRPRQRPPSANELPPPSRPGHSIGAADDPMSETIDGSLVRINAISTLTAAAVAPDAETRANAIEALGLAPAHLGPLLTVALTDPNEGVRAVAATVVGDTLIAGHIERVRPLLHDSSPYVRASAIYALARHGERVDQTPLADLLLTHPNVSVRAHSAALLGKLANPTSVPLLREAGSQDIPRASRAEWRLFDLQLAEALVRLGDDDGLQTVRSALYPSRPEDLEATLVAAQILGAVDDRGSIGSLRNLVGRVDEAGNAMPPEIQLAAAAALVELGDVGAVRVAEGYLNDRRPEVRAMAARVMGLAQRPNAGLAGLLEDADGRVRLSAAAAIVTSESRSARLFRPARGASAGAR